MENQTETGDPAGQYSYQTHFKALNKIQGEIFC